jgi:hypothetical protein
MEQQEGVQVQSQELEQLPTRKRIVQKIKVKSEAVIDRSLHKVVSRKLLVWGTATIAMFLGMVDAENWVDICMVYIGSEAAANMVMSLRGRGK